MPRQPQLEKRRVKRKPVVERQGPSLMVQKLDIEVVDFDYLQASSTLARLLAYLTT